MKIVIILIVILLGAFVIGRYMGPRIGDQSDQRYIITGSGQKQYYSSLSGAETYVLGGKEIIPFEVTVSGERDSLGMMFRSCMRAFARSGETLQSPNNENHDWVQKRDKVIAQYQGEAYEFTRELVQNQGNKAGIEQILNKYVLLNPAFAGTHIAVASQAYVSGQNSCTGVDDLPQCNILLGGIEAIGSAKQIDGITPDDPTSLWIFHLAQKNITPAETRDYLNTYFQELCRNIERKSM